MMDDELEKIWEAAVLAYSKYYPRISLKELREIAKKASHDSRWCLRRDSNQVHPEYKSSLLDQPGRQKLCLKKVSEVAQ
jgi:hypothetical protein